MEFYDHFIRFLWFRFFLLLLAVMNFFFRYLAFASSPFSFEIFFDELLVNERSIFSFICWTFSEALNLTDNQNLNPNSVQPFVPFIPYPLHGQYQPVTSTQQLTTTNPTQVQFFVHYSCGFILGKISYFSSFSLLFIFY